MARTAVRRRRASDLSEGQPAAASAHEDLMAALLATDEARLRLLVADSCHIIGPKGFHLSKDEWIHAHVADVYELRSINQRETEVADFGSTAVIHARQDSVCVFHGERIDGLFQTLSVWHLAEDSPGWQLVALQYTAVGAAAG